jgi:FkbM family methyltransferase
MTAAPRRMDRLRRSFREAAGIARSLRIYHGSRGRRRLMIGLYGQFMRPGDLVFDIGAHVGDRIGAFRALGATVVALEPQPAALRWLKLRYGWDRRVTLVQAAASEATGTVALHVNIANPTVSTASEVFIEASRGAEGWEGQHWEETISVPAITLDALIEKHGAPAFVKIDVEGFELAVLNGLSRTIPALSFEFTTIQRDVAEACLKRLTVLGDYRFNVALGESQHLEFAEPVTAARMAEFVASLPHSANSGDIYAQLLPA